MRERNAAMKPNDTKRLLLTVIMAIGLHLLLITFSSMLLETLEANGAPLLCSALLSVLLRTVQLLLPAFAAYALSGIGLRRIETPYSPINQFRAAALYFSGTGALILLRWLINGVVVLCMRVGITLPQATVTYRNDTYGIAVLLLTGAILPAVCEELFYRRLLMQLLLPFGTTTAVIFTALLFGTMHSYPQAMLYAACSGILLGICSLRKDGIKLCIGIHLTVNLFTVLQAVLPTAPQMNEQTVIIFLTVTEAVFLVLGLLCFVGSHIALRRRSKAAATSEN